MGAYTVSSSRTGYIDINISYGGSVVEQASIYVRQDGVSTSISVSPDILIFNYGARQTEEVTVTCKGY